MLDGKVLTAVLASLAAIGAAINGGGLNAEQVKSNTVSAPGDMSFNDLVPDSLSSLQRFIQNPEPENDVRAVFEASDISDEEFQVSNAQLTAANFTNLKFGGKTASSDEEITVYGYTGKIVAGEVTEFKGRSKGFVSSGVNVSGRTSIAKEIDTDLVKVDDVKRSRIRLDDASGMVESNSSTTEITGESRISINSFSGRMIIYSENSTVVFEGKVDRLKAGDFSFGR